MTNSKTQPQSTFNGFQLIVVGLVFFSFFMSALISRTVFERLPHLEDEVAYLFQARVFARGDIMVDIEQPSNAYWQPFVVSYQQTGNRFSKYTPGWSSILSLGVNFGQEWVINAFFGALTVALVFRLGSEIFNPDVGMVASALTAFSPMTLLLNASFMSHTSAMFFFTMFMYCYWRITLKRNTIRWGILAGLMLGMMVVNRPLTAIGLIVPFAIYSIVRLLRALYNDVQQNSDKRVYQFIPTLRPLVIFGMIALMFASAIPFYNATATDHASLNLYTLVWEYDRVGFGTCCGRSSVRGDMQGHSILKGLRHTRFDLSLTAADLFGWQIGQIDEAVERHLQVESDYYPLLGLSWLLIPFGLVIGLRRITWKFGALLALGWFVIPLSQNADFLSQSNAQIWQWVIGGALIVLTLGIAIMLERKRDPKSLWVWLFASVALSLVFTHLAYWIGSQRYSTRYYFEAISSLALLSAIPIAWLARQYGRTLVYVVFGGLLVYSLYFYSTPRIHALYRYNHISPVQAEAVRERADDPDMPILVIATDADGDDTVTRWRSYGSLMVLTSPYLDSEIVVARDFLPGGGIREEIIERFPDYQIVEMYVNGNEWWFPEEE